MLRLSNVDVCYGPIHALKGVSLSIPEGGTFAVLGANGAGKTTLLRTVMGLIPPVQGVIEFAGRDLTHMPTFQRAHLGIALVPEGRKLFPDFTVGENLMIGAFRREDRCELQKDIETICQIFPILKARYNQRAKTLSGGEGQMLAIGRALMTKPQLLLMDEPSAGLMPKAVSEIFDLIRAIPKNDLTVLLVEQNVKKALSVAKRVAVLELGRIVLEGDVSEVLENSRIREAYLGRSTDGGAV